MKRRRIEQAKTIFTMVRRGTLRREDLQQTNNAREACAQRVMLFAPSSGCIRVGFGFEHT